MENKIVIFKGENNKFYYLYKILSLIKDKPYYYIGAHSTKKIEDEYFGSGKKIKWVINKYGKDNFKKEFLGFYVNKEELLFAEKTFIQDLYKTDKWCCNLCEGGRSNMGYKYTESQIQRLRETFSGEKNPMYGRKQSKSAKIKMSEKRKTIIGWKHTKETKEKMSLSWIGRQPRPPISEETREKFRQISHKRKGWKMSEQGKLNVSISKKNKPPHNSEVKELIYKKVICPYCEREISRNNLNSHFRSTHKIMI